MNAIQLNNKPFCVSEAQLPCLISYSDKTGGSLFSVVWIADLFLSGSKILFLTAYPMATEDFLERVSGSTEVVRVASREDLDRARNGRAILIKSGDEKLFLDALNTLDDIQERVVFVKNIERLGEEAVRKCLELEKIILSGDIDECVWKDEILKKTYVSTILFSQPRIEMGFRLPELLQYTGYLWGADAEGAVNLKVD